MAVAHMTLNDQSSTVKMWGEDLKIEQKFPSYSLGQMSETGVSSIQIVRYLNKKNEIVKNKKKKDIEESYENGLISKKEKETQLLELSKKYSFVLRTVQRSLKFLTEDGFLINQHGKYILSEKCIESLKTCSGNFGTSVLLSLMRSYNPVYNTLNKNISNLVTLFGSYILYSLLEAGRPINDDYFSQAGLAPLTIKEKNNFTFRWLKDALDIPSLFSYFIETFLNQPEDELLRGVKTVKSTTYKRKKGSKHFDHIFTDSEGKKYYNLSVWDGEETGYIKEDGEEYLPNYESYIKVPHFNSPLQFLNIDSGDNSQEYELLYELGEEMYNKIKKKFSENYPKEYKKLSNNISVVNYGSKNIEAREFYGKLKV